MHEILENMGIYFFLIRIAALFGNRKARQLVRGQKQAWQTIADYQQAHPERRLEDCIWFHAASVGEFEQARPIIERLRKEQSWRPILLTFFSPSGYEMRKNYDQVDLVTYLPFATRRNAKRLIDMVKPSMAIFIKYEFWPAYIRQLSKRDIPLYSISSIFQPQQYFFRWYGGKGRRMLRRFTHLFVQDEQSAILLRKHGITQVSIAGDTRFDRVTQIAGQAKRVEAVERFVKGAQHVIVAGSTWPEDEALLREYMDNQPTAFIRQAAGGQTKLILVPHEIDDAHMHTIFEQWQGRYVLLSTADKNNVKHVNTMVVDKMGLLSSIYQYGHIAYVGGGFGEGIHNTIEAAVYGLPVVFGPNYESFREAHGLLAAGAGRSVADYEQLEQAIAELEQNRDEAGLAAAKYVASNIGATDMIFNKLFAKSK